MGLEKGLFAALAMTTSFAVVAKAVWFLPLAVALFLGGRWLSKVDDQYVAILLRYLDEAHLFDATPRPQDAQVRPQGWGRGIPR